MSLFKNTSSGSHSSIKPTINDTLDKVEKSSEISSTIDSEVKAKLDDFDEQFNWHLKLKKIRPFFILFIILIDHFTVLFVD